MPNVMSRWSVAPTQIDAQERARLAQEAFILYIAYKKSCRAECITPATYGAWLWLRGLSSIKPW